MALLLFSFALSILAFRFTRPNNFASFNIQKLVYNIQIQLKFAMFIMLYFYIKSLYDKNFLLNIHTIKLHLIPVIILFIYNQYGITSVPSLKSADHQLYINLSTINLVYYAAYLALIFFVLRKRFPTVRNFFSREKNPNYGWLAFLTGNFLLLWLLEMFTLLLVVTGEINYLFDYVVFTYTVIPFIFISTILILALKSPKIFNSRKNSNGISINESEQHRYLEHVLDLLDNDKVFTDAEISLNKIADRLNINSKYLSRLLNDRLNISFPDLINTYRINESKKLLLKYPEKTIQQIMYEVGYNSKSAFNNHFKKNTGYTPSEFRLNSVIEK